MHWEVQSASIDLIAALARELEQERARNLSLLRDLVQEKKKIEVLESHIMQTKFAFTQALPSDEWKSVDSLCEHGGVTACAGVGAYSAETRRQKIEKYKQKLSSHRAKIAVSREYSGRSHVARAKPRVNGRFFRGGEE